MGGAGEALEWHLEKRLPAEESTDPSWEEEGKSEDAQVRFGSPHSAEPQDPLFQVYKTTFWAVDNRAFHHFHLHQIAFFLYYSYCRPPDFCVTDRLLVAAVQQPTKD